MNENLIEIDMYSVIKQKYIERDVLDKIRAEIEKKHARAKQMSSVLQMNAYTDCLQIIDKYKAESEIKHISGKENK